MSYLFWISIIFILYAYVGYPLVLCLLSFLNHDKNCKQSNRIGHILPKVCLLISAYNEGTVIEDKILNTLALDYPKELLEVVIVSDGSEDRTNEIVARYAHEGVVLRNYEGRIGKTECLNKTVPLAKGDIIVFSDANSKYNRNAIKELVKHFDDKMIGFVTGATRYISEEDDRILYSIGVYSKIEQFTKTLESKICSCVGADGAIFAIRKNLYQQLKIFDINDLVIPFNIIKQGFRGILEGKAYCIEETAKGAKGEFYRQVRITNRTIRAILNNRELINPFRFGLFSFQLLSHKICKLLVPFFMLVLFFSNIVLIKDGPFFVFTLGVQLFIYFICWLGYLGKDFIGLSRLISISHTFIRTNLAILWGWVGYVKGETYTTWTTTR